jgi:hypothetical protein
MNSGIVRVSDTRFTKVTVSTFSIREINTRDSQAMS